MLQTLQKITSCFKIINTIRYFAHRKPRGNEVPTESPTMLPYSINFLHDNPGAKRFPLKLGRGPGNGKGKTSTRGHKGHKSRSGGGVHVRFEGGQTPITLRLPKYGRVKKTRPFELLDYVNLGKIDYFIKRGIIDPAKVITIKTLVDCGLAKKVKFGVKILAKGADKITYPLHFEITDASKTAISQIQSNGGSLKLIYRTPLKLREHLTPEKFPLHLREPIPPHWRVQKIHRKEEATGLTVQYRKPLWLVEEEEKAKVQAAKNKIELVKPKFVYPVPIVENSGKIRKRKPKLYKKFTYNLP